MSPEARRILKIALRVALGVLMVVIAAVGWLASSLPWTGGSPTVAGIAKTVNILRDENGVPHIAAETDDDAYFALGVAHAQDRFWQMEMMRRFGAGRLAEVLGPDVVHVDKWMRMLGLYALAEVMVDDAAPPVRSALAAYARGVNFWLDRDIGLLAPEFAVFRFTPEPWKPADSLVWGKIMANRLSLNWRGEALRARLAKVLTPEKVRELWPAYPADGPTTVAADAPATAAAGLAGLAPWPADWPKGASNVWAVTGGSTDAGGAILANDPHLAFSAPILWYLARVETPDWQAMGATVPGVPFVILAQSGSHAWGMTTTQSDVEDLFIEKVDPAQPERYLTPDGSQPFDVRTEVIKVKGGDDVTMKVRATRHGPVISDQRADAGALVDKDHVVALSATYLKPGDRTADSFYDIVRANEWSAFKAALRLFRAPQQNFFYADTSGGIGFIAAGRVPVRAKGMGFVPTNGWTGETDWTGFIALDDLPQAPTPGERNLVNANNSVSGRTYTHFLGFDWAPPYRAERIRALLRDGESRSVVGAQAIQRDLFSGMARDLLPLMVTAAPETLAAKRALELLRNWEGAMAPDRPEPLIFSAWLLALNRALYGDELGDALADYLSDRPLTVKSILTRRQAWCDDTRTEVTESCAAILARALDLAVRALAEAHGPDVTQWRWDSEHWAHFPHKVFTRVPVLNRLADLRVATGGGNATVNRGAMRLGDPAQPFRHVHGAGYRAVYDLKDPRGSRFMIATGQSGNLLSPKYRTFLEPCAAGRYIAQGQPMRAQRETYADRMTLTPASAR
ncbi:MAG: penicillin acylase family protein [Rhodospirillaceae bacterium]